MQTELDELRVGLSKRFKREYLEIEALRRVQEDASRREAEISARMRDEDPRAFADQASAERDIAHKEAELNTVCYALPLGSLSKKQAFHAHGMSVYVTKATVRREYRPELLRAHPELENVFVDGDPVVVRSVDAAVLDRLVAEKKFDAGEAKAFLLETKLRNPQVRVRTASAEDDEGEEDE